jgi:hypothetical protein
MPAAMPALYECPWSLNGTRTVLQGALSPVVPGASLVRLHPIGGSQAYIGSVSPTSLTLELSPLPADPQTRQAADEEFAAARAGRPQSQSLEHMVLQVPAEDVSGDPLLHCTLRAALLRLPEIPRAVVVLRFQEDLDPLDIAATLDLPVTLPRRSCHYFPRDVRRSFPRTSARIPTLDCALKYSGCPRNWPLRPRRC